MILNILIIITTILLIISIENNNNWWLCFLTLSVGSYIWFSNNFHNIFNFIQHNVLKTTIYFLTYIIIGIIWSFIKWLLYLIDCRTEWKNFWEIRKTQQHFNPEFHKPPIPKVSERLDFIISWILYWPFSLIGTLLNNIFRKAITYIIKKIDGIYKLIAMKIYKDDLVMVEKTIKEFKSNK